MKISNVRIGKATNSSAVHSVIILDKEHHDTTMYFDDYYFARNHFLLATTESKMQYLVTQLFYTLKFEIGKDGASSVIKDLLNVDLKEKEDDFLEIEFAKNCRWNLPYDIHRKFLNYAFLKDLITYIQRKEVGILSGAELEGNSPIALLEKQDNDTPVSFFGESNIWGKTVAYKTREWWVLFNTETGTKIRFSFEENPKPFTKAIFPELIDMNITDYCTQGCEYCYQGSTPEGKHASAFAIWHFIEDITIGLSDDTPFFELILGGGEPTEHPDILEIVDMCKESGINVSLTTKNLELFKDLSEHSLGRNLMDNLDAIGFSVTTPEDINIITSIFKDYADYYQKIKFHFVMGTFTKEHFISMLDVLLAARIYPSQILLLGYKSVKRGSIYTPIAYDWWLDVLQKRYISSIGIDTALAKQYERELRENPNIADRLTVASAEGKFSAYVDAVNLKCGESSYSDLKDLTDLTTPNYMYAKDQPENIIDFPLFLETFKKY